MLSGGTGQEGCGADTLWASLSRTPFISIGLALADPRQREGEACEAGGQAESGIRRSNASTGRSRGCQQRLWSRRPTEDLMENLVTKWTVLGFLDGTTTELQAGTRRDAKSPFTFWWKEFPCKFYRKQAVLKVARAVLLCATPLS